MNDQSNGTNKECSLKRRTNLLAREKVGDCMAVALEKERILFICFGMVLSEVMLRWRSVIDINVLRKSISIL